jgi:hypothetical protein
MRQSGICRSDAEKILAHVAWFVAELYDAGRFEKNARGQKWDT